MEDENVIPESNGDASSEETEGIQQEIDEMADSEMLFPQTNFESSLDRDRSGVNEEENEDQQENEDVQNQIIKEDSADERLGEFCNGADRQQMFPKNRKMKFQYNKVSVISNEENSRNLKIKRRAYVTSCQDNDRCNRKLNVSILETNLAPVAKGKIELKETNWGILVTFYEEEDFTKMMRMSLSKIFDTPVAVWNIPHINSRVNNAIIIRDIPWCIKAKEIEDILHAYGVYPLHSTRTEDGSVRVVVKNPYSLTKLLREGLNFYNCIILPVSLEPTSNPDIIQCYRCQRFWHTAQYCPFYERCVRCGDKHDFRMCTRDRNNPNCCLCGDSHHAAYKYCPVRIQHLNAIQIELNMERE